MEKLYSIEDFISWIQKYNNGTMKEKVYTHSQIATIIAKGMLDFFDETNTNY